MADPKTVDLCIIGAGSAGLSVAAGAAQMGASTVLIEQAKMGGDCLNYGCVPSKSLLAAAHAAAGGARAQSFGVDYEAPRVVGARVRDHVRGVIAAIAPNDSVERFEGFGAEVVRAPARFVSPREVEADGKRIRARRFVVATGSSPAVPPIDGLSETPHLTNETIFDLDVVPEHLIVLGGGPIGMEMSQAHRQLGARVTVLEKSKILPKDDPEAVAILRARLEDEGIDVREGVQVAGVEADPAGVAVRIQAGDGFERVAGSHLLVAAGRRPNVGGLDLERAGIAYGARGIEVDDRLRTTNHRVFAIGDVAGGLQFTHVAGYHAGIVIKNALFHWPARVRYGSVPWVTYTQPELAHVGLIEAEAQDSGEKIKVLRWPYHDNDRAQAERKTEGLAKIVTTERGHVLGATIVGASAGELIQVWVLAIEQRLKIGTIATMIAPYPTLGEINKRAAGSFFTPSLFSTRTRRIVRLLSWFG
jgi:pyruvate/2-oxoglutarate dehydrogenase complex dihydrolipoamide dehydrogenase (E3) component